MSVPINNRCGHGIAGKSVDTCAEEMSLRATVLRAFVSANSGDNCSVRTTSPLRLSPVTLPEKLDASLTRAEP